MNLFQFSILIWQNRYSTVIACAARSDVEMYRKLEHLKFGVSEGAI